MACENLSSTLNKFSEVETNVALKLAKQVIVSNQAQNKNLVFSPLSIHIILGLTAAGSEGPTQEELLSYLKSKSDDEFTSSMSQLVAFLFADGSSCGGPSLSVANGMWVDKKFVLEPKFKEMAESAYKAVVDQVDFEYKPEDAIKKVNKWTNEKTKGLIKQIISPDEAKDIRQTCLMTGNALYFKGTWRDPFDEECTRDYKFFLLDGSSVDASYMRSVRPTFAKIYKYHFISVFDGFKVLQLPYDNGGGKYPFMKINDHRLFSMYIYLPDTKDGLHALVERATTESGFVERHLPNKIVAVGEFRIPKFKTSFSFVANEVLKELGIVSMFEHGITKIVGQDDVGVSRIQHKAFISVNESGTEAAAVTLEEDDYGCCDYVPEKTTDFVAEHPFLYVIREDTTGTILFIGQVCNPLVEE